jgi:ribosomal-protein-alanine N-acetyltransferase
LTGTRIETNRLILREYVPEDWQAVHEYASDEEVCRFTQWGPNSTRESKEFVKRAIRAAKDKPRIAYDLAITLKDEGKAIGGIGLMLVGYPSDQGLVGYVLNSKNWRTGIMSETLIAMLDFGFESLKLHRMTAFCDTENPGSFGVMEKCAMRREAHFIQDKFLKGQWRDTFHYGVLASEWAQRKLK